MFDLVGEVTTWPHGTTDDYVMAQWFGEVWLPNLVAARRTAGPMFSEMSSWLRTHSATTDAERRIHEALQSAITARA